MDPLTYFWIFLKASLFSTGGFGNLPSLHQDLLAINIATEDNFGQSIAVGQVSPGPNGLWSVSLGYLTYGLPGAFLALLALLIPPFFVLLVDAIFDRVATRPAVQGLLRGLALAIVGLVSVVALSLMSASGIDWRSYAIGFGVMALALSGRLNVLVMLALAGVAGLMLFK